MVTTAFCKSPVRAQSGTGDSHIALTMAANSFCCATYCCACFGYCTAVAPGVLWPGCLLPLGHSAHHTLTGGAAKEAVLHQQVSVLHADISKWVYCIHTCYPR